MNDINYSVVGCFKVTNKLCAQVEVGCFKVTNKLCPHVRLGLYVASANKLMLIELCCYTVKPFTKIICL